MLKSDLNHNNLNHGKAGGRHPKEDSAAQQCHRRTRLFPASTAPSSAACQCLPAWPQDGCHADWREEMSEAKDRTGVGRVQSFRAVEILCYDSIMVDALLCTFAQTLRRYNPTMHPKVNCGL